jgi:hypothetical protein
MQEHYVHRVKKQPKLVDSRAIILLRQGCPLDVTVDSGDSNVEVKPPKSTPIEFGHPCGIEEGELKFRNELFDLGAHRQYMGGVSGNRVIGCPSVVVRRCCSAKHEFDALGDLKYAAASHQHGGALYTSYLQKKPIRVFRSSKQAGPFASPQEVKTRTSYRYDGLYEVYIVMSYDRDGKMCPNKDMETGEEYVFHLKRMPSFGEGVCNKMSVVELWEKLCTPRFERLDTTFIGYASCLLLLLRQSKESQRGVCNKMSLAPSH